MSDMPFTWKNYLKVVAAAVLCLAIEGAGCYAIMEGPPRCSPCWGAPK